MTATTILVEPDPNGHRFHAVADVASVARRAGDVVLLTSVGATTSDWYKIALGDTDIEAVEQFDQIYPPTNEMTAAVAQLCRNRDVSTVVVMDGDQSLKRWWYSAAIAFRGLPRRPRVVFMLTRYVLRLELSDWRGWFQRISKASLVLLAMGTRTLHRAGGFAGRDDQSHGLVVKRLRDPAECLAHSRDREQLRQSLGLPLDRPIVGVLGLIDARKSVPLVYSATLASAPDAQLLVAGAIQDDVREWLDSRSAGELDRMILRPGHLANEELDQLVAACDVVAAVHLNKGPSGIMGKALAAGVPAVSAGSRGRARELAATHAGLAADMTTDSIAEALRKLYGKSFADLGADIVPATRVEFAETLLGVSPLK